MTTTAAAAPAHDPSASDIYDPDEVLPRDSPLMKPYRPRLQPSPSPPPAFTRPKVSLSPSYGRKSSNRRRKVRPSQGDAVLIHYLDGGKRPDIATEALMRPLARYDEDYDDQGKSDSDVEEEESTTDESGDEEDIRSHEMSPELLPSYTEPAAAAAARPADLRSLATNALAAAPAGPAGAAKPVDLQSLATDALAAVTAAAHPTDGDDRRLPDGEPRIAPKAKPPDCLTINGVKDGARSVLAPPMSPYTRHGSQDMYSPRHHVPGQVLMHPSDVKTSPTALSPTRPGELPPIQSASPRSETSSHDPLPSIDHLLDQISPSQQEMTMRRGSHFPHSPPSGMLRMSGMPGSHGSPPISPNDPYRQDMPSPANSIPLLSPYYFSSASSTSNHRSGPDYSSNGETPNTDPASTPGTQDSINRMSIDSMTNPPMGAFVCKFQGCTAPPFSTQYLLNSHANVHSSARPHYCPVKGCPRSEGGKGFKRKNEMIRHGLVHDSPGHVRVHHVDKDKDDPLLRDVLAQRPDGPNRGRRRRT
ncbi:hypothetical protein DL766_006573 [Monosporascus sp. MC13-8B]|uniref:C2H2-type domain-containing protein n=1 Tax=Monosporascus cannonballus TaxID=155416 RepID=A0ABY0GZL7_9PEZI|nr:hypothetical protein DL763_008931 [Monosporascus cannonballus]RYO81168.1 hypothetical protein DL762_007268 [Monosporascus cannonballus]RYP26862.1 hypothetical protein DL766_006573 [Monosporascus sp. MC13-8B]